MLSHHLAQIVLIESLRSPTRGFHTSVGSGGSEFARIFPFQPLTNRKTKTDSESNSTATTEKKLFRGKNFKFNISRRERIPNMSSMENNWINMKMHYDACRELDSPILASRISISCHGITFYSTWTISMKSSCRKFLPYKVELWLAWLCRKITFKFELTSNTANWSQQK
jgi:hypothetical protein